MDSWLDGVLSEGGKTPDCPHQSADKQKWVQKVVTAESLTQQGFQDFVRTVRTVRTKKQSPGKTTETGGDAPAVAANDADTGHPIPDDLAGLVSRVATLEGWPQDLQAEHLAIVRRQLVSGECDAETIRAGWLAHIDRWHNVREAIEERAAIMEYDGGLPRAEAERLAGQVNDCMTCRYWQGVQAYPDPRYKVMSSVGIDSKPKSLLMGACAKHQRPWRVSNIPGDADYNRWQLVGQCSHYPMTQEQAA